MLQLDALLNSVIINIQDYKNIDIKILYKADKEYELYYNNLIDTYRDYINIDFCKEGNFKNDLLSLTENYDYVLFSVDDNIFVRKINIEKVCSLLKK